MIIRVSCEVLNVGNRNSKKHIIFLLLLFYLFQLVVATANHLSPFKKPSFSASTSSLTPTSF